MSEPYNKGKGKAIEWIRAHVDYNKEPCLRWPFSYDSGVGRGRLGWNGKNYWAHRLVCEMAHGPAPVGKDQVAHSCGNGHMGCVNPRHLSWSDQFENQKDRAKHGTAVTSKWGNLGKITREQIDRIRTMKGKMTQMALAAELGISHANVRYWQKSTHYPHAPSTDPRSVERRRKSAMRRGDAV